MGIVSNIYKKSLLRRYDKDGYVPYLSSEDFPGLNKEQHEFVNSLNTKISYFYYYYEGYKKDLTVLLLHGLGPGHTAYMREIETLCKAGFKVLTLDYMGCDSSEGERMPSMNEPTRDVDDLLNHLNIKEKMVIFGHSLGAYTTLNVMNIRPEIKKAVVISGFLRPDYVLNLMVGTKIFSKAIAKYEKKIEPKYYPIDNLAYLKNTTDKLLFIHSKDDGVVKYDATAKYVLESNNPNIEFITVDGKGHNPTYTKEAAAYTNEVMGKYYKLKKDKDKKALMEGKSAWKMTEQDQDLFKQIIDFINKPE